MPRNPDRELLSQQQILQNVYDSENDRLRVAIDGVVEAPISQEGTHRSIYGETLSVGSSTPTTVISHVVGTTGTYLKRIAVSGSNFAIYEVKLNGQVIDKKRTSFGNANETFEFDGLGLQMGDVVQVQVTHSSETLGDFNARIQTLEA
jgi:hypothetical protein